MMLCAGFSRRLCNWLGLHVCGIYCKALTASTDPNPNLPGFTARFFGKNEAEALIACSRHPELDLSETFIRCAIDKGDVCAAIICNDTVISYLWLAFSPTHDMSGVHIRFRETDLYCYKALTLPEFRGRRLPRILSVLSDCYCLKRGSTHTIGYIDIHNQPSIRAVTTQGALRFGFAGYFKCGSIFIAFRTKGVRQRGFHFFLPGRNECRDITDRDYREFVKNSPLENEIR